MLRSLSLLGLTALSAAGIAGTIQSQLPQPAAYRQLPAPAARLADMKRQLAITPDQRAAWNAFAAAVEQMSESRRLPAGDMFAALAALPAATDAGRAASARLQAAAAALGATLTPAQRARARVLWARDPLL